MVKALFDTNILIDYLNGVAAAAAEIDLYRHRSISMISWMEVMVGAVEQHREATRDFLSGFHLIGIDHQVAEQAVDLRRSYRLKLPDAIVWASARVHDHLLVTRDVKDLPETDPGIRVPYRR
ncbi:type II toxin-antitoxin system VapC family toxin [Rhizobium sp. RU35A]|uniref:type II toxin-antitoxin system VapC family toxin n=1 Tax=Rhizobium sp. RU35A TaxID=1907414 RepID=UPI00122C5D88|nr:type II toxin-antitoxin system VapC family toxin [Rhizobium sp. RU35A]